MGVTNNGNVEDVKSNGKGGIDQSAGLLIIKKGYGSFEKGV